MESASVSFIGIVDFTEDARWVYCSESVQDLLGFEPRELIGSPSLDLVHPDEFPQVRAIHYSTITQDQAAVLVYLRMRHKDPCKGYVLCAISRTVCQNVLVGSVSFASPGPKAMHNASTAQEVTIITPTAKDFEFRRWNDPSPMPPCPVPPELMIPRPGSPSEPPRNASPMHFDPLPEQSVRTALILDRFSVNCNIMYCSNDSIISTTDVLGRAFFDFVIKRDEELVRSWIDVIKSWGVNERGQPSDGGFGYGKFSLTVRGRDSVSATEDLSPVPRRHPKAHRTHGHHASPSSPLSRPASRDPFRDLTRERPDGTSCDQRHWPPPLLRRDNEELVVDAIFSAHSDGLMVIIRKSLPSSSSSGSSSSSFASVSPPSSTSSSLGLASSRTLPPPPLTRPLRGGDPPGASSGGHYGGLAAHSYASRQTHGV